MTSPTITQLWDLLPHPTPSHVVRMFAKMGNRKIGDFARTPGEMQRFVDSAVDMNVYVAMNPTKSTVGTRHSTADVTHWSYFLIDADPVEEECDPASALAEALLWLGRWHNIDFKRRPPIIVDSGRGMQAWIRLGDIVLDDRQQEGRFIGISARMDGTPLPRPFGVCTRKTARKAMGYWLKKLAEHVGTHKGCRIDTSVADLPRVMRMPGTVNQKTGRVTAIVSGPTEPYDFLANTLVEGVPETTFNEPEPGELPPGTPWQTVYNRLTRKAQEYLTQGKEDPGRHETMWHTVTKLAECGIDRTQARAAISYANRILGDEKALPPTEIERIVEQVYGPLDISRETV